MSQAMLLQALPFLLVKLQDLRGVATSSAMTKFSSPSTKTKRVAIVTLTLGSQPRQKGYKVANQEEARESRQKGRKGAGQKEVRESHHILPRV